VPSTNDTSTTDGRNNTGMGTGALGGLPAVNPGLQNTASGYDALFSNTIGNYNTASGAFALSASSNGMSNTAFGAEALVSNTTGSYNTASGVNALWFNTTGTNNTASGYEALYKNKTGKENTAVGYSALSKNTSGKSNIAMGWEAGFALTTGSNNIDIGNPGESTDGVSADSGVIRIGTQMPTALQTLTYIAGIYDNTSVSGLAVVIDSNGQLGAVSSSERFKTAIAPMGSNTAKLQQLRPVTFQYKADPQGTLRYGLIAEEVAKVYPELVIRGEKGRIDGVRYDELAPMLLNEMQKRNAVQDAEIRDLKRQMTVLSGALQKLQAKDELVANR
jgi:Chaperone of endosialidase